MGSAIGFSVGGSIVGAKLGFLSVERDPLLALDDRESGRDARIAQDTPIIMKRQASVSTRITRLRRFGALVFDESVSPFFATEAISRSF